jgi:hypothetical protein
MLEEKEKKKKKVNDQGIFPQYWTCLSGCSVQDFHSYQMQLKAGLRISL